LWRKKVGTARVFVVATKKVAFSPKINKMMSNRFPLDKNPDHSLRVIAHQRKAAIKDFFYHHHVTNHTT
jgi:hypothetical protein